MIGSNFRQKQYSLQLIVTSDYKSIFQQVTFSIHFTLKSFDVDLSVYFVIEVPKGPSFIPLLNIQMRVRNKQNIFIYILL